MKARPSAILPRYQLIHKKLNHPLEEGQATTESTLAGRLPNLAAAFLLRSTGVVAVLRVLGANERWIFLGCRQEGN